MTTPTTPKETSPFAPTSPLSSYTVYEWDHRNRLASVTDYDVSDVKQQQVVYGYDAYNNLISRDLDSNGDGTVDQSGYFIYDNGQIVLQLDSTGDVEHRMLWGAAVDQILADENDAGDVHWMLTDNQNTVRDIAEYDDATDTTSIVNHIAYSVFGEVTSQTNSSLDALPFYYTARYFDAATGLQYNTNRWYNAELNRWMSQDPIGFDAGDANLYRYVGNGFANWVDPSGLRGGDWLDWAASWSPIRGFGGDQYDNYFTWSQPFGPSNPSPTSSQPSSPGRPQPGTQASIRSDVAEFGADWKASDEQLRQELRNGKDIGEACQREFIDLAPGVGQVANGIEAFSGEEFFTGEKVEGIDKGIRGFSAAAGPLGAFSGMMDDGAQAARKARKVANATGDVLDPAADVARKGKKVSAKASDAAEKIADVKKVGKHVECPVPSTPKVIKNGHLAGKTHPVTGVPFDQDGFPVFQSNGNATLPKDLIGSKISDTKQFQEATRQLWDQIKDNPARQRLFTTEQLQQIKRGKAKISNFTWHHHQDGKTMQLVDEWTHSKTGHSGGRQTTGGRR
ncbi:HNH endonuclease [Blastopirellula retiformator]|uniref:Putative deoxyribonuclease RhsC n=1 Tax=Blastopirellula retiformator TaxID=2527970 RepID=A0A5C5UVK1_9BACT|nr:HNH endonuclease [Blastopirellula retiformator]TWT29630.1 putative deoxyribonuclease RhsC [Blastopirellula retiformator]